jgi:hypothetical protein
MANVLLLDSKTPFCRGADDALAAALARELRARNHRVDIVELPFDRARPGALEDHTALWQRVDLRAFAGAEVDLAVALRYPSYYAEHPRTAAWLIDAREFSENDGAALRRCALVAAASPEAASALRRRFDIEAAVLAPPAPECINEPAPWLRIVDALIAPLEGMES